MNNLDKFKRKLESIGVSFEEFKREWKNQKYESLLSVSHHLPSYIITLINWTGTRRGYTYWETVQDTLDTMESSNKRPIAGINSICDFPILKKGSNWYIGCQTISKKQRLRLFELLADDLDYELGE